MTHLLIVDDDERNLYALRVLLEGHDYHVASARDGVEALEMARINPPDMIISDILMPVMDGFALCRAWKNDEELKHIPFIFYTATYTDPKDEQFALKLGVERFLIKPMEPAALIEILQEIVATHEAGQLVAPRQPIEKEEIFVREYNEALIRKLEDKRACLEEANRALERDIVERMRVEEALRESEARFRLLVQTAGSVIIVLSSDRKILEWNEEAERIYGWEREEVVGKDYVERCVPKAYREAVNQDIGKVLAGQRTRGFESPVRSRDGSEHILLWNVSRLADAQGQSDGVIAVGQDITEREQAEAERLRLLTRVQEQAQRVQQIIDTVPEGVLLLDAGERANWCVVLANPLGERNLLTLANAKVGDALTHLGNRPLAELLTSPPRGLWHELAADGQTFQVIARPIEIDPAPGSWVLVIRDVTKEREIQQRVQQQERLAAVGQLAAGIAHDFNNIMATITLYAQMSARAEGLPLRVRERMETINQQARHASKLIHQILDFSRRTILERQPLDLIPLLKEQTHMLKRILPENIKIALDYGGDEYAVNGDLTSIHQVIMNLALNARDAMPSGGDLCIVLERIEIEPDRSPPLPGMQTGEWIQLTISDTGVGIPPENLPHTFEPFFTTKSPGEGSGLGLAQVHGIVGQHEGHIDVQSHLDQGTIFTIYLPALPVRSADAPTALPEELAALARGQGETVLVVEDNPMAREAVVEGLELLGYRALTTADGRGALEILERQNHPTNPDADHVRLVLSDVVMPEMGGIVLFHALRQRYPEVRMVLMTGHPVEGDLKKLRAQGLRGWLLKPPELQDLAQVTARALKEGPPDG